MSRSAIQMTRFQVEALKCIGGEDGVTPHTLITCSGSSLGNLGSIMNPMGQVPMVDNDRWQPRVAGLAEVRNINEFRKSLSNC